MDGFFQFENLWRNLVARATQEAHHVHPQIGHKVAPLHCFHQRRHAGKKIETYDSCSAVRRSFSLSA
jgi:hypothetical protein